MPGSSGGPGGCPSENTLCEESEVKQRSTVEETQILSLLQEDREEAIRRIHAQYERYLASIAYGILRDEQDAEECVNDVMMQLWDHALPTEITNLKAYLSKATRNQAITVLRSRQRKKRGGGITMVSYEELSDCLPDPGVDLSENEDETLRKKIDSFLDSLPGEKRLIFLKRYWRSYTVAEIAKQIGRNERYVTNQLYTMRQKLKRHLDGKDE